MHELSVCRGLLRQLEQLAAQHGAIAVSRVECHIGPLSGIEPSLLQQAFPFATAGSLAEGAELVVRSMPVVVHCRDCGHEQVSQPNRLVCSHCGSLHTQLVSGDEMLLANIDLEYTSLTGVRHV